MRLLWEENETKASGAASFGWRERALEAMRADRGLKLAGIGLLLLLFFTAYIDLARHPLFPVRIMPELPIDRAVGFYPGALLLYVSLWAYLSIAAFLIGDRRELAAFGIAAAGLALAGLALFAFWPTRIAPADVKWSDYSGFASLKAVDLAGNACPSLHAAFAVFSALEIERQLRTKGEKGWVRALSVLWCLGILYSTLATKQHVFLDLLAGTAFGVAAGGVLAYFRPRKSQRSRLTATLRSTQVANGK